ncbi:DUF3987 domain-containing protein [Ralstonia pseudosolanacearum]|uniref:DUF3987 domain-containing protein n=1 Tax=Ralstonia pseudosolanacearum TaxID=1310165 RepID=UPI000B07FB9B|nr:DUF3987 domain-containing protein [Ralstonia pseudosolanacearum]MCL1618250.1 YfjI family protein [Ralstonia pseudosolanacearum CaRs-Mep]
MFYSEPMSDRTSTSSIVRPKGRARVSPFAPSHASYPDDSFPGLLGMVAGDLSASGGVAPEIVGTTLIVIASLLTQGLADVSWPNGKPISIGANGLVVSPSGSGKTLPLDLLKAPIETYLEQRTVIDPEGKHDGLLHEDVTREELVRSLKEWPVAALITDEGGIVKRLLKDSPTLVKLLDGTSLRYSRVSSDERIALIGPRFCMLLMEQPDLFEETKSRLGGSKGGVGMINRFFIMRSTRLASGSPHDVRLSADVAPTYEKKVHELLDALVVRIKEGNRARTALKLSAKANPCLIEISNDARRRCSEPNSPWADTSEYVLRHAERVLRFAGVLHVFEYGPEGEVSLDTLERAESFGNWYVDSYRKIFCEAPKLTQAEVNANQIAQKILSPCVMRGLYGCSPADLRTAALNLGLTSSHFNRALAVLCEQGRVTVIRHLNKPWILFDLAYSPLNW